MRSLQRWSFDIFKIAGYSFNPDNTNKQNGAKISIKMLNILRDIRKNAIIETIIFDFFSF